MPIYEYRCAACGFQNEYLQKVSDPLLTVCPQCGALAFAIDRGTELRVLELEID